MDKFIPYEKLSKKEKKKLNAQKRSRFANVDMTQRCIDSKKKYDRNKLKSRRRDDTSGIFVLSNCSAVFHCQLTNFCGVVAVF